MLGNATLAYDENGFYDANTEHVVYTYYTDKTCAHSAKDASGNYLAGQIPWVKTVTIKNISFGELSDSSTVMAALKTVLMNGRRTDTSDQFLNSMEIIFQGCTFNQKTTHLQVYKILPVNATKYTFSGCTFNQTATGQYAVTLNCSETGSASRPISYTITGCTLTSSGRGINVTAGTEVNAIGTSLPKVIIEGTTFTLPTTSSANMAVQIAGDWDNANLMAPGSELIEIKNNTIVSAYGAVRVHSSMSNNETESAKYLVAFSNNTLQTCERGAYADGENAVVAAIAASYDAALVPASTESFVAQIGETKYETLAAAIAACPTDGTQATVKMLADVSGINDLEIKYNQNVSLDLNGHVIAGVGGSGSRVFKVMGVLAIADSNPTVVHKYTSAYALDEANGTVEIAGGAIVGADVGVYALIRDQDSPKDAPHTVTLTAGNIVGCTSYGVHCAAPFKMSGGKILGCDIGVNDCTFALAGGEVSHNTVGVSGGSGTVDGTKIDYNGTGINTGGSVTLNSGSIDYNSGKAVIISGTGSLTVNGGSVSHNKATAQGVITSEGNVTITGGTFAYNQGVAGGAIYLNKGVLTISGGTFDHNTASSDGGAIHINNNNTPCSAVISGGTFTNNSTPKHGGAIWSAGSLRVSGGTFKENTASNTDVSGYKNGGGAIFFNGSDTNAKLTISGTAKFEDNKVDAEVGRGSDVYVRSNYAAKLEISGGSFAGEVYVNGSKSLTSATVSGGQIAAIAVGTGSGSNPVNTAFITGGTFSNAIPEAYCAEGYIPSYDSTTGKYGVKERSDDWIDYAATSYTTAVDTANKVVTITSPAELGLFAKEVNNGKSYAGYTITISGTIDLEAHEWVPVYAQGRLEGATIQGGTEDVTIKNLWTTTTIP